MTGPALAKPARTARLLYARDDGVLGCPEEPQVRDAVSARLGYDPFDEEAEMVISARIEPSGAGLLARIVVQDAAGSPRGERQFASRDRNCIELVSAMVMAISIAIDPLSVAPLPQPVPPPARPPPSPPSPAVRTVALPEPPVTVRFGLGALAGYGSVPAITPGFLARASVQAASLSIGLEGRLDLPASEPVGSGRVRATAWFGSLVGCGHRRSLALCGLLGVGRTHATAEDLEEGRSVSIPLALAGPRAAWALPLRGRFGLLLHADLLVPLWQPKTLVGRETAWSTQPVSGALGAALQARLW